MLRVLRLGRGRWGAREISLERGGGFVEGGRAAESPFVQCNKGVVCLVYVLFAEEEETLIHLGPQRCVISVMYAVMRALGESVCLSSEVATGLGLRV